jgi:hypothetical protein
METTNTSATGEPSTAATVNVKKVLESLGPPVVGNKVAKENKERHRVRVQFFLAPVTFLALIEQFGLLGWEGTGLVNVQPFSEHTTVEQEMNCNVQSSCRAEQATTKIRKLQLNSSSTRPAGRHT